LVNSKTDIILEKKKNLELKFTEYKGKLEHIFLENSSFNKTKYAYIMPYSKLVKLIHSKNITYLDRKSKIHCDDSTIQITAKAKPNNKLLELNDLDLMLHNLFKQKKLHYSFPDFIKTIEKLCEMIYSNHEEKPKECLIKFTQEFFIKEELNKNDVYTSAEVYENGNNNMQKNSSNIDLRENFIPGNNAIKEKSQNEIIYNSNQEKNKRQLMEKFILDFTFDIKIKIILISILETLVKIYKSYFYFETNKCSSSSDKEKIEKNSFHALIKFCSDFNLVPYLFSFEHLSNYWNLVTKNQKIKIFLEAQKTKLFTICDTNDPDLQRFNAKSKTLNPTELGFIFRFYNFCIFLIHISELATEKQKSNTETHFKLNNSVKDCSKLEKADKSLLNYKNYKSAEEAHMNFDTHKSEKFLFLLENFHRSNGFLKFEEKICMAFNTKYSLLPPLKVINLIIPSLAYDEMLESERHMQIEEIKKMRCKKIKSNDCKSRSSSP